VSTTGATRLPRLQAVLRSRKRQLKRDGIRLNHHRALALCLSMIFSENRYTLFRDHAVDRIRQITSFSVLGSRPRGAAFLFPANVVATMKRLRRINRKKDRQRLAKHMPGG
jgi:hypothetical protein